MKTTGKQRFRRRLWAIGLSAVLLAASVPMTGVGQAKASPSALAVWTTDALTKVFQTTAQPANASAQIRLLAARNERRAAQIAVRSDAALTGLTVAAGALAGPNGSRIDAANIHAQFVDYIHLPTATSGLSADKRLVPPGCGADYPDRIGDETSLDVAANTTQPIWYSVDIPKTAPPGTYTGTVTVSSAEGSSTVDVSLKVYDVTLPDPDESSYRVDNWLTSAGWTPPAWQSLERQLGVEQWSPDWWQAMENFAAYMREHRNNTIYLDPIGYLEPVVQFDANGDPVFDWSLFDRAVQLFIDAGALKYVQGPILSGKDALGRNVIRSLAEVGGQTKVVQVVAQSPEAEAWLDAYLPALGDHLQQKGWLDAYYQSVGDEPATATDIADNEWAYDKIHALAPGIRTLEAVHLQIAEEFAGKLDTYVARQNLYDAHPGFYKERISAGDEVWLYVANLPTGNALTRAIDAPLSQVLLAQWYTFKNGLSGYLHWGFNYWNLRQYAIGASAVTASSSIETDGWSKARAVDNVSSSPTSKGWSSVSHPDPAHAEWIKLDLAAVKPVTRIMLYPYRSAVTDTAYGFPNDVTVKLSQDGSNWTTVVSQAVYQPTDPTGREFNIPKQDARYALVEASDLGADEQNGYSFQLGEVQLFNDDVAQEAEPTFPGDSWLVYPDKTNLGLYSSIRAETMLEGIQDHELLQLLKDSGKADIADNIAESLVDTGTSYNADPRAIQLARQEVLDQLTGQAASAAFVDTLDDLSQIWAKSAQMDIDRTNPVFFGGDAARLFRRDNSDQYAIYYKPNITSFTAQLYSDSTDDIEFWGSADNKTWYPLDVALSPPVTTYVTWFGVAAAAPVIPWGTNYLKIVFKGSNAKSWVPQLGQIGITYGGERAVALNETFDDQLDDMSQIWNKSSKMDIDHTNPVFFAGDTDRLFRRENSDQYAIYYKPNITSFTAQLYSDSTDDIDWLGSADGSTWYALDVVQSPPVTTYVTWFGFTVSASAVPPGTNYLKLVLKGSNAKSWVPQLGDISIAYGNNEVPSLVANSGFEAGLWGPRTSGVQLETAAPYNGSQSAVIEAGSAAQFMSGAIVNTQLGDKYSFSVRLKTEGISTLDGVKVELMQVDENGNDVGVYGGAAGTVTAGGTLDWTRYSLDNIVPLTAGLRVVVRTDPGITGTVRVDNVVLSAVRMPETFTDTLDSLDRIFDRSARFTIDSTNPALFNDDKARLMRTENSDQYIVYNGVNMTSFTAAFYSSSTDNVDFYVSPDNTNWTSLSVTSSSRTYTLAPWYKVTKSANALPAGTNYLKLVFRDSNTDQWLPQLGQITIVYDYDNAQYEPPVSLVRNSGFELGAWPAGQGNSLDTTVKHGGDMSARLTGSASAASIASDAAAIDAGSAYSLSLWLKTNGVTANGATVELMQVDGSSNDIGVYAGAGGSLSLGGTQDWTRHTLGGLASFAAGTAALQVIVRMDAGASGTVWADDIVLEKQ
ncbi:MAG: discoidin domain-containing protein [Paenibacillaceae bacterium]|nr:discoidin domain-containing protein [Paenibacillaceae bacterium]